MKTGPTSVIIKEVLIKTTVETPLVVQCLRIHQPRQGTQAQDQPACRSTTKPTQHSREAKLQSPEVATTALINLEGNKQTKAKPEKS